MPRSSGLTATSTLTTTTLPASRWRTPTRILTTTTIIAAEATMLDDFLVRALAAGLGVALVAGPLGCFVALRRMSYVCATTAHATLHGIAPGLDLGLNLGLAVPAVNPAVAPRPAARRSLTHVSNAQPTGNRVVTAKRRDGERL